MPVERPRRRHLFFVGGMLAALALLGPSVVRHRLWAHDGTCRIEVSVSPADAIVSLDGSRVADHSPAAITVPAGAYTLTVERDGYVRVEERIEVRAGVTVEIPVVLTALPPPSPAARAVPRRSSPPAPSVSPSPPPAPKPRVQRLRARAARPGGIVYVDMKEGVVE